MVIMVVDDHDEVRDTIAEILEENGYSVVTAKDGKNAIDLLAVYKVDLIITDIRMPKLHGTEFILRLRQSKIPIISLSGMSREEVISEIIDSLGIKGFLRKPFSPVDMLKMLKDMETDNAEGKK